MKVAYLAPYDQGTGYSNAAISYILALDSVGVTVAPRPIKMTNTTGKVPDRVKELEDNDLNNVDVVIQHNLPNTFMYKGGVKNVGVFSYETNSFANAGWTTNLKLMDKVLVSSYQQKLATLNTTGISDNKIEVVPFAVDAGEIKSVKGKMDLGEFNNALKFYTICELGKRKNLAGLILAYTAEFSREDNVVLVIKTHSPNRDENYAKNQVKELIRNVRAGCNRFSDQNMYPPIIVLTSYMSRQEIIELHNTCDIFVTASHGEAWCLPAIDAAIVGNELIVPNFGVFRDYHEYSIRAVKVSGMESRVFGVNDSVPGLYTAEELWFNINTDDLGYSMRWHGDGENYYKNKRASLDIEHHLSYKAVGNKLIKAIKE